MGGGFTGTQNVPKRLAGAALRSWLMVLDMVINLRRFEGKQWIPRTEWNSMHPDCRKEMIESGYVGIGADRVYLMLKGLRVLTYTERTG